MSLPIRKSALLCTSFLTLFLPVSSQTDYSQYVNPFIGSEGPIPGLAFGGG
jgi:hypothetical protein